MKTWLLRPYPDSRDRLADFENEGVVAVGWPLVGDISGLRQDDFRKVLEDIYKLKGMTLTSTAITFDMFLNQMSVGDVVLVPHEDEVVFARVDGDYYFDATNKGGYAHQRKVTWKSRAARKDLSMDLRSALKNKRAIASLEAFNKVVSELAEGTYAAKTPAAEPPKTARRRTKADEPKLEPQINNVTTKKDELRKDELRKEEAKKVTLNKETPFGGVAGFVAAAYPLRPDFLIELSLPKNLTKDESERLAAFVGSIYFTE